MVASLPAIDFLIGTIYLAFGRKSPSDWDLSVWWEMLY